MDICAYILNAYQLQPSRGRSAVILKVIWDHSHFLLDIGHQMLAALITKKELKPAEILSKHLAMYIDLFASEELSRSSLQAGGQESILKTFSPLYFLLKIYYQQNLSVNLLDSLAMHQNWPLKNPWLPFCSARKNGRAYMHQISSSSSWTTTPPYHLSGKYSTDPKIYRTLNSAALLTLLLVINLDQLHLSLSLSLSLSLRTPHRPHQQKINVQHPKAHAKPLSVLSLVKFRSISNSSVIFVSLQGKY